MEPAYWRNKWTKDEIGFHQARINTRLQRWWPSLELEAGSQVLVPLCGKTLDMLWLLQQGHQVLGIELSEIAVRAFFDENEFNYESRLDQHGLQHFVGTGDAESLHLIAGDWFSVPPEYTVNIAGCYDRASLVALPGPTRQQYAAHLAKLLPMDTKSLLITMNYDPTKMSGPPFAVSDQEVRELFATSFTVNELEFFDGAERLGNLRDRGLDSLQEYIYCLQRRPLSN